MKKRILLKSVVAVVALLVSAALISGTIWPRINDVKTGETPEYPDIQPQQFSASLYQVFDAALATAHDLGWDDITEDRGNGEIHAVETTALMRFHDDITISVKQAGTGVIVNMRSHSRVGKGDLGTNARRIRRFQAEMKKRL
ncbi:MAG: DUF1499 domain-containing protein [Blastocatellia bacterium]